MILKGRQQFAIRRIAPAQMSPLMALILAFLLSTTLAAGLFAAVAILWPESPDAQSAAPDWKPPTLAVVELDPPKPASADVQTLTRPIFTKNRRPAPKAAARPLNPEATETAGAPPGLSVGAIVKSRGVARAFVISSATPDGEWKKVGETVENWTISSIAALELTLTNGDQAVKLRLYSDATEGPPDSGPNHPPEPKPETPPGNIPVPAPGSAPAAAAEKPPE